jgi:pimeloyl-ACP methyl ester carboxylesterase
VKGALTVEIYAEYLRQILLKEKVKKLVLLGHSMGGYITLAFAEKHAAMLSAFGLLNSHCYADTAEKKASRKKTIAFITKNGTKDFIKQFYDGVFDKSYKKKHPKVVKRMLADAAEYKPQAVIAATRAMINRKDRSQVLVKSRVPVLLISGKDDEVIPLDLSLKQASLAPFTEIHLLKKSKHMSLFEKKKETKAAIWNFLELLK